MQTTLSLVSSVFLLGTLSLQGVELEDTVIQPEKNNGSFYVSLLGGAAFFPDGKVDVANNPSGAADFDLETGYTVGARLGYDFGRMRVEGELTHTEADISKLDTDTGPVSVGSQFISDSLMVNVLWDFDVAPFVVSVGGGIGASKVTYDQMANGGFIAVAKSEETLFTGQLIFGASYEVNESTSVGINYRYQMISDLDDNGYVDTAGLGPSDINFDDVEISVFEVFCTMRF